MAISDPAKNIRFLDLMKKMADETITIREYFEAAELHRDKLYETAKAAKAKKLPPKLPISAVSKSLRGIEIDLDSRWSALADVDSEDLRNMLATDHSHTSSSTITSFQAIEKRAKEFFHANRSILKKNNIDVPKVFPFSFIAGKGGLAQTFGDKDVNPKAYQIRGTDLFERIPKHHESITALTQGLSAIQDVTGKESNILKAQKVRQAIAFNYMVFFRPGEIGQGTGEFADDVRIRVEDVDLKTGFIKGVTRGNKTRPPLTIPDGPALEILRDAIGSKTTGPVFDVKVSDMTAAINGTAKWMGGSVKNPHPGSVAELFKEHVDVMGREVKGIKDIRKIVPSLLATQLGANAGAVSSIMGHDSTAAIMNDLKNMTTSHYVSPVVAVADEDVVQRALMTNHHMFARFLNVATVNELIGRFDVPASRLWDTTINDGQGGIPDAAEGKGNIIPTNVIDAADMQTKTKELTKEQKKSIKAGFKQQIALAKERIEHAKFRASDWVLKQYETRLKTALLVPKALLAERKNWPKIFKHDTEKELARKAYRQGLSPEQKMTLGIPLGEGGGDPGQILNDLNKTYGTNSDGTVLSNDDAEQRALARSRAVRTGKSLIAEGKPLDEVRKIVSEILEKTGQVLSSNMAKRIGLTLAVGAVSPWLLAGEVLAETAMQIATPGTIGGRTVGDYEGLSQEQLLDYMQRAREDPDMPSGILSQEIGRGVSDPRTGEIVSRFKKPLEEEATERYLGDVQDTSSFVDRKAVMRSIYGDQAPAGTGKSVVAPRLTPKTIQRARQKGFVATPDEFEEAKTPFMKEYEEYFKNIGAFD